ncbi:MAG: hypothetical protein R2681_03450 [Pyrinomonadaceae bacterium]
MTGNTSFRPFTHGFYFSNHYIRWSWGAAHGRQLCGGMAFASLDFFYYRMTIPSDFNPPEEGTPLHNYILRRQLHAHTFAIPRLISGGSRWRDRPFEACLRGDRNFGIVKSFIDNGRPIPILLASNRDTLSTDSHWVTAIGYESERSANFNCEVATKILLYDNNRPNVTSELVPDHHANCFKILTTTGTYGYYAPYPDYTSIRPTAAEMAVRPNATQLVTNPFNI